MERLDAQLNGLLDDGHCWHRQQSPWALWRTVWTHAWGRFENPNGRHSLLSVHAPDLESMWQCSGTRKAIAQQRVLHACRLQQRDWATNLNYWLPQLVECGRVWGVVDAGSPTHAWSTELSQHVTRAAGGMRPVSGGSRFEEEGLRDNGDFLELDVTHCVNDLLIVGFNSYVGSKAKMFGWVFDCMCMQCLERTLVRCWPVWEHNRTSWWVAQVL